MLVIVVEGPGKVQKFLFEKYHLVDLYLSNGFLC